MPELNFITDFRDQAVLLPLAFCVGLGFALMGWRRGALTLDGRDRWHMLILVALHLRRCGSKKWSLLF
jgi:hypothetical protein